MYTIKIIAVGNLKEKYLKDACNEYLKRMQRFAQVQVIEIKEQFGPRALETEAENILKHLSPADHVIALCVEGKQMESTEFATHIQNITTYGKSSIAYVIGSSEGLSPAMKQRADLRLGFSKMTFPHQLMRVILLEQIYRSEKIRSGEEYHK